MEDSKERSYDYLIFTHLVSQTDPSEKEKIEKEIKERLAQFKLGDYNQAQVDYIRQFKNELISEIKFIGKSKYFHKVKSRYSELEDFNIDLMTSDFHKKFDRLDKGDLKTMISHAVWYHYLK